MQTRLPKTFLATDAGAQVQSILRSCVHCGFCNATCPTYQLDFDELEGPRGRIYLMKSLFEAGEADRSIQQHLDNCLSCKACESTCPSDVNYHRLLDLARPEVEKITRPLPSRLLRAFLLFVVPFPRRFKSAVNLGRLFKPLLPSKFARQIPNVRKAQAWPSIASTGERRVLLATACVQAAVVPSTDYALSALLAKQGVATIEAKGCCGTMAQHLGKQGLALAAAKQNIDLWWPHIEAGVEALIVSSSGCAPQLKDYGEMLANDPDYADKAKRLAALVRDPVELLEQFDWKVNNAPSVALHTPCSLVHGLKMDKRVRALLEKSGVNLVATKNDGVCCGSAGTYSILNAGKSQQLLANKLDDLSVSSPELIATANIGCQLHLESGKQQQVLHWVELLYRYSQMP